MKRNISSYSLFFKSIALTQIWGLIILLLFFLEYNSKTISLTGYFTLFVASIFLLQALYKNHLRINLITALFLIWSCYLIFSSTPLLINNYQNYLYLKQFISGKLFIFLLPFLVIAYLDLSFYKSLFRFSYKLIILYLIITVFLFFYLIQDIKRGGESLTFLMGGVAPLLMTLTYHSRKHRFIIIISVLILLFEMMIIGRRNVVLYYGSVLFFSIAIGLFTKQTFYQRKKINYLIIALVIAFFTGFVFLMFSNSFEFFWNRVQTGMQSREGIIELFFDDFNKTPSDWILGRGVFGQFEGGVLADDKLTGLRDGIENGYLYLILKGGWIYLGLLILVSVNAMFKGFFKSRNLLVKGFASIILIYYIDMIGFGIPSVSLKYILVFVSIAACNNKWLRNQTDQFLSTEIGLKK